MADSSPYIDNSTAFNGSNPTQPPQQSSYVSPTPCIQLIQRDQHLQGQQQSSSASPVNTSHSSPNSPQSTVTPQSATNPIQSSQQTSNIITNSSTTQPPSALAALAPRSCVTCRKRKVRCDKSHPCANCVRASTECVFPKPGRAPRRSKKLPESELLARLRRLEGVVQSLGRDVDADGRGSDEDGNGAEGQGSRKGSVTGTANRGKSGEQAKVGVNGAAGRSGSGNGNEQADKCCDKGEKALAKEIGRLVIDEGRSRYVSNNFWVGLTEEIAELRDLLDDPTEDEADYPSPESSHSGQNARAQHQGFIFGYSSAMNTLRILHPTPKQVMDSWEIYKENVDPLIRLLHKPTMEPLVRKAAENLENVSKPVECMLFAIYLATVTSLSAEECQRRFEVDRDIAIKRYRFATEQALARVAFLETQELIVIQAFVLFLIAVRRHDDTKFVWTMTGLAVRIANSMGVHRDGSNFGLPPFEVEMRRRLWWQLCTLDIRASEDQGADPVITDTTFDCKLPANVNDVDIWPGMKDPPVEHVGCTEMTFDLIRCEISNTVRYLSHKPVMQVGKGCVQGGEGQSRELTTLEEKERIIERLRVHLEEKYLKHCDLNVPVQWVAANVARLVMAKMWLVVHHPLRRADGGTSIPQETKERLFLTSIDVIRYSRVLEMQQKTMKWGWLFRTYVQWHAVAFLLAELCVRTSGPGVDEGWRVLEGVFSEWGGQIALHKKGMLWKPLRRLLIKARAVRARELERRRRFPIDGTLGPVGLGVDGEGFVGVYQAAVKGGFGNDNNSAVDGVPLAMNSTKIPAPNHQQYLRPTEVSDTSTLFTDVDAVAALDPAGLQGLDTHPVSLYNIHPNNPNVALFGQPPGMIPPWLQNDPLAMIGTGGVTVESGGVVGGGFDMMGGLADGMEGLDGDGEMDGLDMDLGNMNWEGWDDMVRDFNMDSSGQEGLFGEYKDRLAL